MVSQRTATVNQIRAFLLAASPCARLALLANCADALTPRIVNMLKNLAGDLHHLDQHIDEVTGEIETLARDEQDCRRLMTIPGIGPIIASAMVAAIGGGSAFRRGQRDTCRTALGAVPVERLKACVNALTS